MAIVYRSVKGSNLTAAEVDGNFSTLEAQVAAKAAQGVGIAAATLVPNNMLQFQLTDHSYLPPVGPLPTAQYRFRGAWQPNTGYLVNDTFSEGGSGFVVLLQHTSAATFDPNATDGSGHNLYGLYFSSVSSLPAGGPAGASLVKASSADYNVTWSELTLAGLADVIQSPAPDDGDLVYWDGAAGAFSYIDQASVVAGGGGGGGGGGTLAGLSDVNIGGEQADQVLTWNASNADWENTAKQVYQPWSSGGHSLNALDLSNFIDHTATSAGSLTIQPHSTIALPDYAHVWVRQATFNGQVTVAPGSGVTLNCPAGRLPKTRTVGSVVAVRTTQITGVGGTDVWEVDGDLAYDISSTVLPASGGAAIDPTAVDCDVYTLTPTATATFTAASAPAGRRMTLVVTTSGTTSYTLTFGAGFKSQGTLATGAVTAKVFSVSFIGDGVNLNEVSRTTAM